ncbi:hypothetical protein HN371_07610 [Candidatus Poribacteria bacterium]|jgi:DNA-binding cell septation regulator SpoVG|nr:hypothetical protein [Candidatus Poribacteria bacterium]MBT5710961.1 hypothetical protein [Candidatus Poribacteria bacterium]MBT7808187.1 hypothetical protein [Candidatus Poribacteria bacterium]
MANVNITRFEWENDDKASIDIDIGQSQFLHWNVRRYQGANGVRHFVNPPARRVGDDYHDTVVFPATLKAAVDKAALDAFEAARRARDDDVDADTETDDDIPF